jgi:hypothetical protein
MPFALKVLKLHIEVLKLHSQIFKFCKLSVDFSGKENRLFTSLQYVYIFFVTQVQGSQRIKAVFLADLIGLFRIKSLKKLFD